MLLVQLVQLAQLGWFEPFEQLEQLERPELRLKVRKSDLQVKRSVFEL